MTVDLAITNAIVVTVDTDSTILRNATVVVDGGAITAVTTAPPPPAAKRTIDAVGGIVLPGLVNTHAHLAMTMFRGLADDMDLASFLARLLPAEGHVLSAETVAAGATLGIAECLRGGITSVLDMYFFPEPTDEVARRAGLRLHHGPVFVEFPGADGRRFDDRMTWAAERLAATEPGRRWVCPHSTYLLDEHQLGRVADLAAEVGARVHVHAAETATELRQVDERHGRSPVEVLRDAGLLGPTTVLAHAVHLSDEDMGLVAATGAAVAHCPASNHKLASGVARIPELLAMGVPVALGTDGAASANDLDLWMAMRLASYAQSVRHGAGAVPVDALVRMATIDGARALGIAHLVGSVEVGKRADLVVLDGRAPSLTPNYDPASTVAYAAGRGDVRWVLVDGRVVVDDGVLTSMDVAEAVAGVARLRPRIEAAVS